MRKLKVYLDTSVISYLDQNDVPERMKDTLELWKDFVNGKYDIYLSQITLDEIEKCSEDKRNILYHIVNIKTIRGVRAITNLEGYKGIDIINPSVLLESEE